MSHIYKKISLFCYLVLVTPVSGKILIMTHAYNRPDFIEIQYKTFKKFLSNDYMFLVFNDATDPNCYQQINDTCAQYDIPCIPIPQEIHDRPYLGKPITGVYQDTHGASARNATVVQYSLDTVGFAHNDIVAIIDSDLFLVKPFNLREYMKGNHIAAFYRSCCDLGMECEYKHSGIPEMKFLWIGLTFLDMKYLPHKKSINFNCSPVNTIDLDAGGYTYYYVYNTPSLRLKQIQRYRHLELICQFCTYHQCTRCWHNAHTLKRIGLDEQQIRFAHQLPLAYGYHWNRNVEFFLGGTFIHYRCGSNYSGMPPEYIEKKNKVLHSYIKDIVT